MIASSIIDSEENLINEFKTKLLALHQESLFTNMNSVQNRLIQFIENLQTNTNSDILIKFKKHMRFELNSYARLQSTQYNLILADIVNSITIHKTG